MKRWRQVILQIFSNVHLELLDPHMGKGNTQPRNEYPLGKQVKSYFQGNLMFATPNRIAVVTADTGGGLTQLVKCWYFVTHTGEELQRPMGLFYISIIPERKSKTLQELWDIVWDRARCEVGPKLKAHFATCPRPPHLDCHADISPSLIKQCQEHLLKQGILGAFRTFFLLDTPTQVVLEKASKSLAGGSCAPKVEGFRRRSQHTTEG